MRPFFLFLWIATLLPAVSCTRQQEPPVQQLPSAQTTTPSPAPAVSTAETQHDVPARAREVLRHVRETGKPPEGYVGGRVFENRERNLPSGGRYREYDVNRKIKGKNRGPERLVIDQASGKAWFTPDHYRTFILIK